MRNMLEENETTNRIFKKKIAVQDGFVPCKAHMIPLVPSSLKVAL